MANGSHTHYQYGSGMPLRSSSTRLSTMEKSARLTIRRGGANKTNAGLPFCPHSSQVAEKSRSPFGPDISIYGESVMQPAKMDYPPILRDFSILRSPSIEWMDLQTANLVAQGHLRSAWVRLIDPLSINVNRDAEFRGIVTRDMAYDKVPLQVDLADAYNWMIFSRVVVQERESDNTSTTLHQRERIILAHQIT
ncbi:hypothetical protein BDP27DRAFT_1371093 [Rhodocollybia butyracea]|uniref:Uncharacterized protein n=1 Tax=Rhodocollybia butyracea TaxID=206335 RepID=A0A9P5TYZ2_9AGAR|nr:hypothetical protein BDP27DRAFT_1371093 [Rhodocollybia butyracea]